MYSNLENQIYRLSESFIKINGELFNGTKDVKESINIEEFLNNLKAFNGNKLANISSYSNDLYEYYANNFLANLIPYREMSIRFDVTWDKIADLWIGSKFSIENYTGDNAIMHFIIAIIITQKWLERTNDNDANYFLNRLALRINDKKTFSFINKVIDDDRLAIIQMFDNVTLYQEFINIITSWFVQHGVNAPDMDVINIPSTTLMKFNKLPMKDAINNIKTSKGLANAIAVSDLESFFKGIFETYYIGINKRNIFAESVLSNTIKALFNHTFISDDFFEDIKVSSLVNNKKSYSFEVISHLDDNIRNILLQNIVKSDVDCLDNLKITGLNQDNSNILTIDGKKYVGIDINLLDDKIMNDMIGVISGITKIIDSQNISKFNVVQLSLGRNVVKDAHSKSVIRMGNSTTTVDLSIQKMLLSVDYKGFKPYKTSNALRIISRIPFSTTIFSKAINNTQIDLNKLIDAIFDNTVSKVSELMNNSNNSNKVPLLTLLPHVSFIQDNNGDIIMLLKESDHVDVSLHNHWKYMRNVSIKGKTFGNCLYMNLGKFLFDSSNITTIGKDKGNKVIRLLDILVPLSTASQTILDKVSKNLAIEEVNEFKETEFTDSTYIDDYYNQYGRKEVTNMDHLLDDVHKRKGKNWVAKAMIKFLLLHDSLSPQFIEQMDLANKLNAQGHSGSDMILHLMTDDFVEDKNLSLNEEDIKQVFSIFMSRIFSVNIHKNYVFGKYTLKSLSYVKLHIIKKIYGLVNAVKSDDSILLDDDKSMLTKLSNIVDEFTLINGLKVSFNLDVYANQSDMVALIKDIKKENNKTILNFFLNYLNARPDGIEKYYTDLYKYQNYKQFLELVDKHSNGYQSELYPKVAYCLLTYGSIEAFYRAAINDDMDLFSSYKMSEVLELVNSNDILNYISQLRSKLGLYRSPMDIINDINLVISVILGMTTDVPDSLIKVFLVDKNTDIQIIR